MGTTFDDIEDIAMITIRDYRIDNLAMTDPSVFRTYLDGFLIRAVPKFVNCLDSLEYDESARAFARELKDMEKEILACFFNIEWMTAQIQDVTEFRLHMKNREFSIASEGENLKQKRVFVNDMREKANQLTTDYQIQNLNKIYNS